MQLIRTANTNDLPAIKNLLQTVNLTDSRIESLVSDFIVLITKQEIIGVAGIENHFPYALIRSVAIQPEFQHKQMGSKLINALIEKSLHQNFKAYFLLTESATAFFENLGFIPIARENVPTEIKLTNEFKNICPASAIVMKKEIQ